MRLVPSPEVRKHAIDERIAAAWPTAEFAMSGHECAGAEPSLMRCNCAADTVAVCCPVCDATVMLIEATDERCPCVRELQAAGLVP